MDAGGGDLITFLYSLQDLDLVLHFRTKDNGIALGDTEACLISQTYHRVPIMGCDSVRTVPPE